ncbi:MAG: Trk system potassium transporter TrkA [Eubacteriales bacterium]
MRIVIIGCGKIGLTLTESLSKEEHDITVVDTNAKVVDNTVNIYDVMGIHGNGANYSVQIEAGVNHADLLVATTSSDEVNMLCCLVAKKVGAKNTIARIRDPEYSKQFVFMLDEMGLDMVVNPEYEAASEISRSLRFPSAIKLETFSKGRVEIAELKIMPENLLDGQKLSELNHRYNTKILVCAIQRDNEVIIPSGSFILKEGDRIHFTASHSELASFFKAIGAYQHKLRNVIIIGGGRIAIYLAQQLLETGMSVKIIEMDEKRCFELSELLPKVKVIAGDGTDQSVLMEENIKGADACVAITGIDEENIIVSLYAKNNHVNKVITKVNRSSLIDMLGNIGLDCIISPKQITSTRILRYVRAMQNSKGSRVQTLYRLVNNQVEALEFYVSENNMVTGKILRDLKLKPNLLISVIIRQNKIIFPGGNDYIEKGDNVIVVTANERLRDLNDILR